MARTAIPIGGGIGWRALFAWQMDDLNILLSGYITSESRILLHRNIKDRVGTIAPFVQLDRDHLRGDRSAGRLYWMQDAYTTSAWFPYAKPEPDGGDLQLHPQFSEGGDRRLQREGHFLRSGCRRSDCRNLSPNLPLALFKPLDAMPPDLQKAAFAYPTRTSSIFKLCSIARITMDAPEVFYNPPEDLWQFPREATSSPMRLNAGSETRMA